MDKAQPRYLVGGNHRFGRVNLGRATALAALETANELVREGYMDVRICTPRGVVLRSGEFDQLDLGETATHS
jgi:hypothetical protein